MTFIEKINNTPPKKIVVLIAPLDWGLGHASRCIPIIKYLKSINCTVIVATDGMQQSLLAKEFPELNFVKLPGYGITFSKNRGKTLIKILSQIPKILISINQEHTWLKQFLRRNRVDLIISDNRYGFFNKAVSSIFITHQLTIKTPFGSLFENLLRKINYHYINSFTECWIPDFEGSDNLGGQLSHPKQLPAVPVKFLGRLSRITEANEFPGNVGLLIILSGPEPQRSIFEKILLNQLQGYSESAILVRGLPGETETSNNNNKNLTIYNHVAGTELNRFINNAAFIISRPGYSSIMDLIGRKKKCIFIATPGQSEQEYLAEYLSSKNFCLSYKQNDFRLGTAINDAISQQFTEFKNPENDQYKNVIDEFIKNLKTAN